MPGKKAACHIHDPSNYSSSFHSKIAEAAKTKAKRFGGPAAIFEFLIFAGIRLCGREVRGGLK
jgi:hypothetical protein